MLVLKYHYRVMNLVSRYLRSHSEAQDIPQEAVIKAYRALPAFRGNREFEHHQFDGCVVQVLLGGGGLLVQRYDKVFGFVASPESHVIRQ